MAGSYSHNALSAKARAKFGKRLTLQNYNELLACQSVGEAALYLKSRTYFGPFLSEVRSVDVHRGRIEELLRRKSFEDYSSLCVFEYAGREFYTVFVCWDMGRRTSTSSTFPPSLSIIPTSV